MKFFKILFPFFLISASVFNASCNNSDDNLVDETDLKNGVLVSKLKRASTFTDIDYSRSYVQAYEKSSDKTIYRLRFAAAIKMTSAVDSVTVTLDIDGKTTNKDIKKVYQGLVVGEKTYYYDPYNNENLSETLVDPNYYFAVYQIDIINDLSYLTKEFKFSAKVNNLSYNEYIETSFEDSSTALEGKCIEKIYSGDVLVGRKVHKEHAFDSGKTTKEASCTEPGTKIFTCDHCQKIHEEIIPLKDHRLDLDNPVIVHPTISSEGSILYKCSDCGFETEPKKLAKLTTLSIVEDNLCWSKIANDNKNADHYKVIVDDNEIVTVNGDVTSYDCSNLNIGNHKIEVRALFDDSNYIEHVGASTNLRVSINSVSGIATKHFYPTYRGAGNFSVIEDEGCSVIKLDTNGGVNWDWNNYNVTTLYGISKTFQPGTYEVSLEIKLGEKVSTQALYYGSYGASSGWFPGFRYVINLNTCSTTEYTTVKATYSISDVKTGQPEIGFGSLSTSINANSYVLIKNAKIIRMDSTPNNDTSIIYPVDKALTSGAWDSGVYYTGSNNKITITNDEGASVLKAYTTASSISFSISGNMSNITKIGTYALSIKVKLGPDATNVNNIGFRCSVNAGQKKPWDGDNTFSLTSITSSNFVTLTKLISITDTSNSSWLNIDFWIFTHNDSIKSENNYVLFTEPTLNKIDVTSI